MKKAATLFSLMAFVTVVLTSGCATHSIATDTKGLKLQTAGVESVGHIHTNRYYLTLLWIVPILPGDPTGVQTIYNEMASAAEKEGATGLSDVTSAKFSFPFPLLPVIVMHKDTMTGNMFK